MKLFYEKDQDAEPTINKREAGKEVVGGKICTHRCTDSFFRDTNEFSKSASGKERKRSALKGRRLPLNSLFITPFL